MKIIEIKSLKIPEVKVLTYQRFADERGYFTETYRKDELKESFGGDFDFVQANESFSRKNTVRGLHFQWNPYQGKLVRCTQGHLIDFALDIRTDSTTFGKIIGHDMLTNSGQDKADWIWLPPGFAHGVIFPEESTIEYLCTGIWSPGNEATISPMAQDIDWSLCDPNLKEIFQQMIASNPLMADKDKNGMNLGEWKKNPNAAFFTKDKL